MGHVGGSLPMRSTWGVLAMVLTVSWEPSPSATRMDSAMNIQTRALDECSLVLPRSELTLQAETLDAPCSETSVSLSNHAQSI